MINKNKFFSFLIMINSLTYTGAADATQQSQSNAIETKLAALEAASGGRLGISAINTGNNQRIQYRAHERFPMGCTSKVIGVAAVLKESMRNPTLLQEKITYQKKDLDDWAPIAKKHLTEGMTVDALSAASISYSDNTTMNLLAKKMGGPKGLNQFARSIGDNDFKLDHMWPDIALASPHGSDDSTTPAAMEKSLQKLVLGNILAAPQREKLTTWLKNNVTGDARIRAGVPKTWRVGDKTGSGFHYGITNDIAVIWPPQCAPIVLAIYYSNNKKASPKREDLIASATRILLDEFARTDQCIKRGIS